MASLLSRQGSLIVIARTQSSLGVMKTSSVPNNHSPIRNPWYHALQTHIFIQVSILKITISAPNSAFYKLITIANAFLIQQSAAVALSYGSAILSPLLQLCQFSIYQEVNRETWSFVWYLRKDTAHSFCGGKFYQ